MIGVVAESEEKKIGVVCSMDIDEKTGCIKYEGMGFDGKSWSAFSPKMVAKNVYIYIEMVLEERKHVS
jgi:hypothetical protein